jgi:monomeric sarcosine oxidase
MRAYDLGIIGGGIMGATAAWYAARQGARVILFDQAALPNVRGASVDHSKVFRFAYPDPLYVRMAVEALPLWRELERESGRELLLRTGLVLLGRGAAKFERACLDALRSTDCATEQLSPGEAALRWPQFSTTTLSTVVFDPSGAVARAEDAVRAALDLARHAGVMVHEDDRVTAIAKGSVATEHSGAVACDKVLVAAGPWSRSLLPQLASHLRVTRQEVLYFAPRQTSDFTPDKFPIFLDLDSGFYGFPVHHHGAMKIANHQKGPVVDPNQTDATVRDEHAARAFFREFIPGLEDAPLIETKVCCYNNTPDDDFVFDWHPAFSNDVLIATGFSGHGFKFGPLIGKRAAELLLSEKPALPWDRFRLRRFTSPAAPAS